MVFVASLGKRLDEDLLTPYKFSLLLCVREVCHYKNELRKRPQDSIPWFRSQSHKRDFLIATLTLIQGPDLELSTLMKNLEDLFTAELYNAILMRLREVAEGGVSKLMDYFSSLETLLVDPSSGPSIVHRSSIIGLFLRRMMLAFDKLLFAQTIKLYHSYQKYCSSLTVNSSVHDASSKLDHLFEDSVPTSRRQAELFVARQVALLQINPKAAIPTVELQHRLRRLIAANPTLSEAHFLNLMNCIRAKEYSGAIHALHRAFDGAPYDNAEPKCDEFSQNFRYASLNLGTLLSRFGFGQESLLALNEAMTMAREAGDHSCLQHALSWLYRLETERKELLLERSIAKAGELSLPYLTSLGILMYSQLKAKTVLPAQVFEFLRKCDILNCQHSILDLTTQSFAQRAGLWNMYGKRKLVALSTQLLLHLNATDPSCSGTYLCGESLCLAFCHMAQAFADEGKYDFAAKVLLLSKEEFPVEAEYSELWTFTEQVINYDRALYQGHWEAADTAADNLSVFDEKESRIRKAEVSLYKGDLVQCHRILDQILSDADDPAYKIRALNLQGLCYCQGSTLTLALLPLCKGLALAQKHHLNQLANLSTMYMAYTHYLMDHPYQALNLLDRIKIVVISQGCVLYRAKISLFHAKCLVKLAESHLSEPKKTEALIKATEVMGKAAEDFLKINAYYFARDAYFHQAVTFNILKKRDLRNTAAYKYKQLDQQCGSSTINWKNIL
ncbi:hypothetical protein CHUAL_006136 [Chamberlinius hualienensis]